MTNKFNELIKKGKVFDSHCHLNSSEYDKDFSEVVDRMKEFGVESVIDIGIDYNSSFKAVQNSIKFPQKIYAAVGVDMESCVPGSDLYMGGFDKVEIQFKKCEELVEIEDRRLKLEDGNRAPQPPKGGVGKIIMIGETGIDLYWNRKNELPKDQYNKSFEEQAELFKMHIELASENNLPLSIHSRDSIDECIKIINDSQLKIDNYKGVFHSLTPEFNDDEDSFYNKIKQIHELGFLVGLNGIVTFKSAKMLREVVLKVMKENMNMVNRVPTTTEIYEAGFVFETDGPWLAPTGKRGERNEPAYVGLIHEFIVEQLKS